MKILSFFTIFLFFNLILGCQSRQSEKDANSNAADIISVTGLTGDSIKLIKTASVNFKVRDARLGVKVVSQVAQNIGGIVTHQNIESGDDRNKELRVSDDSIMVISCYNPHAEITVRVPAQNLEAFMDGITDVGYFVSSSKMDIDDKSLEYLAAQLRQQNRKDYLSLTANKNSTDSSLLATIHTTDEVITNDIGNRQITADAKFSTVRLNLFQNPVIAKEMIANYSLDDYKLSFGKRLSDAMSDGWEYFISFILAVAPMWIFIIAGIATWFIYRYYQYRSRSAGNNVV